MKRVVTGLGADGRSSVVEEEDISGEIGPGAVGVTQLWRTKDMPPTVPFDRPARGDMANLRCAPGSTRWFIARMGPGCRTEMHRSDTIDYDVILDGEVTLLLEDGEVLLQAGDCVVIPGVLHAWRGDEQGYSMSVTALGMEPAQP